MVMMVMDTTYDYATEAYILVENFVDEDSSTSTKILIHFR